MRGLYLFLLRLVLLLFRKEAVRLNLYIERATYMAKIGDTFLAKIAPTNAAGNPAPVFGATYTEGGDSYDITPAPDGLSAVLVARAAGTGNFVDVNATTKSGNSIFESLALPDVEPNVDEEATKLNLSVTGTVGPS
jgi:hypothetical protein